MPYKVGIAGYGNMGCFHHLHMKKPSSILFTSAYDISEKRLQKARENGLETYDTLDDFLKSDIDVVLVSTPNDSHCLIALSAIRHAKHVILEKPATINSNEFELIMAAAEKNNVLLTVHHNRRMNKDFKIMESICNSGVIGDVFRIESRVEGSRGIADTWRRKKEFGGGMLYDWGVHLIDQMLSMIPCKVQSVFCEMQTVNSYGVDDNLRLNLIFQNGVSALIEVGTCNFIMHPRWYMLGKTGSAQIDYWDLKGRIVKLINSEIRWEDEIRPSVLGPSLTMAPRAKDTAAILPLPEVEVDDDIFYRNFVEALKNGEKLWITPSEIMRVMKIIDLAFQSASENQVIKCCI